MKCKKSKNNPPQYSVYTPSLKYIFSDNTNYFIVFIAIYYQILHLHNFVSQSILKIA